MKIAVFEIEDWEKPYLQEKLQGHELTFFSSPLDLANVAQIHNVEAIAVFIYSVITEEVLNQLPDLKYIVTRSTGFDHINLDLCKQKNILVSNVPEYGTYTVAEHTFSLMLAISRKLLPSIERARKGDFSLDGLRGFDLHGKTLGVIGTGHIGQEVIKIARGFGMNVLGYNHRVHQELADELGFKYVSVDELLAQSDIVSLHLPYSPQTNHFINKENVLKMKKGSVLLNTARGGLIETEAILVGLDSGILSAAGIDVLEEEAFIKEERQLLTEQFLKECDIKTQLLNHVLLTKDNVLITPHNAFNSQEALQRILDVTIENLSAFAKGERINLVN